MCSLTEAELDTATPSELLCLAAQRGRTDLTISALRSGALVNVLTPDRVAGNSSTALHIALGLGHVDVARALLSAGASLAVLDSSGRTAVQVAAPSALVSAALAAHVCQLAASGDTVRLQDAVDAQLDLERADAPEQGNTPLHWAAAFGQVKAVEMLLEAGVDPDPPNARGDTPLRDAAAADHVSVVRTLVAAGADPFKSNKAGSSPVDMAPNGEVLSALQRVSKPTLQSRVVREEKSESLSNGERGGTVHSPATSPYAPGHNVSSRSVGVGDGRPAWATLLWPRPQRFIEAAGPGFTVPPVFTVSAENNCMAVARMLLSWLCASRSLPEDDYTLRLVGGGQGGLGESIAFSASVFLRIDSCALEKADQAYSLSAKHFGIDVVGSDLCGLFYGCCSLLNVFKLKRAQAPDSSDPLSIPAFSITDWPSVRRRGLYLDMSGRRLPKQQTLRKLVEYMAIAMKMNQLQINIGSNFEQLESNAEEAAFRHEHILELNEICKKHFVELIPVVDENEPPRKAENVDELLNEKGGGEFESGCTENKSAVGREKLYDEFLPLFDSPQVSVGCLSQHAICELSDLERLREAAKSMRSRGKSNILTFSNSIAEVLADHVNAAGLLAELPARSIFIVEAVHPDVGELDMNCRQLSECGVSFYTCSSSCLESSISGCYQNFLKCSSAAIEVAVNQGASGVLLKDKISNIQGAPMVFLYLSLVPFAGTLWNSKQEMATNLGSPENSLSRLYNTYVFQDPADKGMLGKIAGSLGDFHKAANIKSETALSDILSQTSSEVGSVIEETGYLSLRRAVKKADKIETALLSYNGNADPADVQELRAYAILMGVAARLGASLLTVSSATSMDSAQCLTEGVSDIFSLPDGRRSDLCNALLEAIDLLRETWMQRYHDSGFPQMVDSVAGKTLSKLAHRMPYQDYVEERKANDWARINQ